MAKNVAATEEAQAAFGEERLEDADLLGLLEKQQKEKEAKSKATGDFKTAYEDAQTHIAGLELDLSDDRKVRIGRFVLKLRKREAGSREFDVKASESVSISLAGE